MKPSPNSVPERGALRPALVVLVWALLLPAPRPAAAQLLEDYRFKGRVVDTAGNPIAGVLVTLRDVETGARIVFRSHDDGTFDRRMIPHAIYDASFEKPGYVTHMKKFDWSAPTSTTAVIEGKIVLESQADHAAKELGKKAAQLYEQGYAALAAGDCTTASKKAAELLQLGAGTYEYAVRFVLARCHAMQGQLEPATAEYEKVIALKPDLFEAHFDLALVLDQQAKHEDAIRELERAAELHPEDVGVHYNAGAILFRQQHFEAARPHLEKVVALDSMHAEAHKALGFVNLQSEKKDLEAARRHLQRYLALAPTAADTSQVREILAAIRPPSPEHR